MISAWLCNTIAMQPHRNNTIFAAALTAAYASFIAVDIALPALRGIGNDIKFICMAFCLLLSLRNPSMDGMLTSAALAFSLLSDYLLMYTPAWISGMVCFCCVHLLHIRRLRPSLSYAYLAGTAAALGLLFALLHGSSSLLIWVCAVYAVLLCSAMAFSLRRGGAFWLGMLMFVLCDSCVVVYNLLAGQVSHTAYLLIWPLYIPAQLLLIRSASAAQAHAEL